MNSSQLPKHGFRSVLIADAVFEQLRAMQRDSGSGVRFDLSVLTTAALRLTLSQANAAEVITQQALLDVNTTLYRAI